MSELSTLFNQVNHRRQIRGQELDIYIPKYKVGVEYDGRFYHKGKELVDRTKYETLKINKVHVVNVRETPLPLISQYSFNTVKAREFVKQDMNVLLDKIK